MARRILIERARSGRVCVSVEASNGRELVKTPELDNARAARGAIDSLRRVAKNGSVVDTTRRGAGRAKLAKAGDAIVLEKSSGGTRFRIVARGKEVAASHPYTQAFWARAAVQRFRSVTSVAAIEEESADARKPAPARPARGRAAASRTAKARPAARKTAAKPAARKTAAKPAARKTAAKPAARKTAAKPAAKPAAKRATAAKKTAKPAAKKAAAKSAAKSSRKKK